MTYPKLRHILAAAALLATALGSQAATVTFSGYAYGSGAQGNGNTVNVSSYLNAQNVLAGYNGPAGAYKGVLSGFGSGFDGAFESYCVDLGEYFSFGTAYSSFTLVSALSHFGAAKAAALGELIRQVYGDGTMAAAADKDMQATAVQLAVWNIVYDSDYSLSSGSFAETGGSTLRTTTSQYIGANALLSTAQAAQRVGGYDLFVLRSVGSPGQQDQLIWRLSTVPEPASLALVGLALGAAGLVSRRRRG